MTANIRRIQVEDSWFVGEVYTMKYIVYGIFIGLILVGLFGSSTVSLAGKWEEKANMHVGRYTFATSTVNGKVYAIGGQDNSPQIQPPVEEYDPVSNTWTQKVEYP